MSVSSSWMHVPCFLGTAAGGAVGAALIGTNAPLAAVVAGSSYILNQSISYMISPFPKGSHIAIIGPQLLDYSVKMIARIAFTILFAAALAFKLGVVSSVGTFTALAICTCVSYFFIAQIASGIFQGLGVIPRPEE